MILLDTHAWVRWLHPELASPLPLPLREWMATVDDSLAVSIISCWEVAQLVRRERLVLPLALPEWFDAALEESGVLCLPLTPMIVHASVLLPEIHRDPADRLIIATAQAHEAPLITADATIRRYPDVRCLWES